VGVDAEHRLVVRGLVALGLCLLAGVAAAQQEPGGWRKEKCARYAKAWHVALERRGTHGLGPGFLARHAAFLASGCTGAADVCPRTPEELALANDLVVASMNAGMASTFAPFACRKTP